MQCFISILLFVLVMLIEPLQSHAGYFSYLQPTLSIGEEYTDNVDRDPDNARRSDFISTISPGLAWDLRARRAGLNLSYNPSFEYYVKNEEDTTIRQELSLGAWSEVSFSRQCNLMLRETLVRSEEQYAVNGPTFKRDPEHPVFSEDETLRRNQDPYYTNTADARLTYQFGPDDSVFLSYQNGVLQNEDPESQDSIRHVASAGATYWFDVQDGMSVTSSYTKGDFSGGSTDDSSSSSDAINQLQSTLQWTHKFTPHWDGFLQYAHSYTDQKGGESDYQVHHGSIGVDCNVSETTFYSLSAGYFVRDEKAAQAESGYSIDGDFSRQFQHWSVRLAGGIGYEETFFGAENLGFTKYKRVSIDVLRSLSRRMSGSIVGSYMKNTYADSEDRQDDIITVSGGLSYTFLPWLMGNLRLMHRSVSSTLPEDEYDENTVFFGLTLTPRPIRFD
jgi:hypothetical protein